MADVRGLSRRAFKLSSARPDDPAMSVVDRGVAADSSLPALAPPAEPEVSRERMAALSRTAALVESSGDPIIGLTLDGLITDWNPAAERLYGYSAEEALGASIGMLVPPERRDGSGGLLATVRAGDVVRQVDTQRMAK